MEPTLAVIGLNFRTSPVAVRERFWISPARRAETLLQLVRSEGIEEIIVLATCNRTEFILWASDVPTAANSVLRFLTQEYQLKLCEWSHFYRLMDDVALTHIFRVISSLDSMVLGEPEITGQVKDAWALAQEVGTTGRFLDAVMQKALTVSKRTRSETAIGSSAVSVPYASVELSRTVLGELNGTRSTADRRRQDERTGRALPDEGGRQKRKGHEPHAFARLENWHRSWARRRCRSRTDLPFSRKRTSWSAQPLLPLLFSAATKRKRSRESGSTGPW